MKLIDKGWRFLVCVPHGPGDVEEPGEGDVLAEPEGSSLKLIYWFCRPPFYTVQHSLKTGHKK